MGRDELELAMDHVTLSVADLPVAKAFYAAILAPLGLATVGEFTAEQSGTVACPHPLPPCTKSAQSPRQLATHPRHPLHSPLAL